MNGLSTSVSLGSWGEQKTLKSVVCEIIDSKLDFVELKTRRLLDKFRRKDSNEPVIASHRTDDNCTLPTMADLTVNNADTELIFGHLENLSRTVCILEQLKFSLREENVYSIMEFLGNDKYLQFNDFQLEEAMNHFAMAQVQA